MLLCEVMIEEKMRRGEREIWFCDEYVRAQQQTSYVVSQFIMTLIIAEHARNL